MEAIRKIVEALKNPSKLTKIKLALLGGLLGVGLGLIIYGQFMQPTKDSTAEEHTVQYSEFLKMVESGKIASAKITSNKVDAVEKDGRKVVLYHNQLLYNSTSAKDLAQAGVDVQFSTPEDRTLKDKIGIWVQGLYTVLVLGFFVLMGTFLIVSMRGMTSMTSWPEINKDTTVKFADVAGQQESKYELEEIKDFLKNPAAYDLHGAKAPRGVLMVGPPGTGKTMLARALAAEAGVNFIPVTGSDFSAMYVGVGRNRIAKLFRKARRHAPCIIFIDEIDSLARKRGGGSDAGREYDTTLNQLLTEMNGFKPRDGIVVIGATNRLDVLDPAVLRPGRFDRHVHVNLPDMDDRAQILAVHMRKKPISKDVDLSTVARGTPGFSGADLENLANEAAILAAREQTGRILPRHFEEARDKVLMGLQRASMVMDDAEKKLIAVHEAGHAVVACLTPGSDPVHQATIIPRGRSLGLVMRLPARDRISVTKSKLLADLDVLMAGRAAEEIVFGAENVTTGASSDIEQATNTARSMVCEWGMSDLIGMVRAIDETGKPLPAVEGEIRKIIDASYARAKGLLLAKRHILDAMSAALLDRKTLDGQEVRAIATEQLAEVLAA